MRSELLRPSAASFGGEFETALRRARRGDIDLASSLALFRGARREEQALKLFAEASRIRDENLGRRLSFSAHIHMVTPCEVSPACKYCSLSSSIRAVEDERAKLPRKALIDAVRYATDRGVQSIVLVGGTDLHGSDAAVREVVETARSVTDVELGLDVGPSLSPETLDWLKGENARTVFCSIETVNAKAFRRAKPGDDLDARIRFDAMLERHDLRQGNVVMNGLGSTEDLLNSILFLRRFRSLSYLYISTFHPVRGTPFARRRPASLRSSLKALAIARFVFPAVHLGLAEVEVEDPGSVARVSSQLRAGGGNTLAGILIYRHRRVDNLDRIKLEASAVGFT
jgi:biotin synthase